MPLFYLFLFLFIGVIAYFRGTYTKKNPYLQIKNDIWLSKKRIPREAVEIYSKKIAQASKLFGIFYIFYAFAQLLIRNNELSLAMIFIPLVLFIIYMFYCRKIVTGKFNYIATVLISLTMLLPIAFIVPAYIEPSVIVDNEQIRITGIYGERIPIEQVKQVFLADTLPNIGMRTNGISTGTINKGYFHSRSLERSVKLLLHGSSKPVLYIIYGDNDKHVILNFRNRKKTQKVYEKLKGLVEKRK
jgi:hypothetical protein